MIFAVMALHDAICKRGNNREHKSLFALKAAFYNLSICEGQKIGKREIFYTTVTCLDKKILKILKVSVAQK
jgi:hypothetical protein